MTALTERPIPDLDFQVPVRVDLPAQHYRALLDLATRNQATINELLGELARRALAGKGLAPTSTPPAPAPTKAQPQRRTATPSPVPEWAVEQLRALCADRATDAQIAQTLGCHINTARAWRIKLGLPASRYIDGARPKLADHEAAFRAAHARGLTDYEVADALSVTRGTAMKWRHALNLPANATGNGKRIHHEATS